MKNLDLNAYGVQEMNLQEMGNVNGGDKTDTALMVVGAVCTAVGTVGTIIAVSNPVSITALAIGIIVAPTAMGTAVAGLVKWIKK